MEENLNFFGLILRAMKSLNEISITDTFCNLLIRGAYPNSFCLFTQNHYYCDATHYYATYSLIWSISFSSVGCDLFLISYSFFFLGLLIW